MVLRFTGILGFAVKNVTAPKEEVVITLTYVLEILVLFILLMFFVFD